MTINKYTKDKIIQFGIYGANYLVRPLGHEFGLGDKLGNPFWAMGFAAWDSIIEGSKLVKNGLAKKIINVSDTVVKIGGVATFGYLTGKNLYDFANFNYEGLQDFPFNASMAYNLGKGLADSFK